jgi:3-hydroxybutyryl-CoA dehydrogenase
MELTRISKVLVVGAGQMGQGIAQVLARARFEVTLADRTTDLAVRGKDRIQAVFARLVAKQKLTSEDAALVLGRIRSAAVDALEPADLAIEAVSEDLEIKRRLFQALDATLPAESPLFSNTSSISITRLGAFTRRPERVLGMHFMNPVPLMQLVELIPGVETTQEIIGLGRALAERLGKVTVLSQDRPGFILNRVLIPFLNEACLALEHGVATVEDIDHGVRLGLNHPMGPLGLADLIGLDTVLAIAEVLQRDFGDDKYRPSPLLRNLVAAGRLGRKSGRGFYDYRTEPPTALSVS